MELNDTVGVFVVGIFVVGVVLGKCVVVYVDITPAIVRVDIYIDITSRINVHVAVTSRVVDIDIHSCVSIGRRYFLISGRFLYSFSFLFTRRGRTVNVIVPILRKPHYRKQYCQYE